MDLNTVKITVMKAEVEERGGTFKDDEGKDREYTTRKQKGKLEAGGWAYPVDLRLEVGQSPFPVGEYELDIASMLQVNKGVMSLSKFAALRPLTKPAARAA